ncbi:MAG: cyclic nucleotide-binding domain-containing protein [Thermoanaerobaculales bacterium]|jgi:CRP-like cAMP-binding protein|nr:cyclic nucleotide-binding domain-containing protein [Thermoanaerobaculales bacterium]
MSVERLEGHEVFQFLRPEQLETISDVAEIVELEAGDVVYRKSTRADHFYVLLEGQVALRLPGKAGVSLQVEELTPGAMFGSCVCFKLTDYSLEARCTTDSKLLKIESATLRKLMDRDLVLGYTIQTQISRIYFHRYLDAMKKLQAIVLNLPLETASPAPAEVAVGV